MQQKSNDDRLHLFGRKLPTRIQKWAGLCDWERAEFGALPPHRPGSDHQIRPDTEDSPLWVHPNKMNPSKLDELRHQLDKLHRSGQIPASSSPYGASWLLVRKANGKLRMCVDYRAMNTRIVQDQYRLPSIQSILSRLGGPTVFSKTDVVSGLYQNGIHDEDVKQTAFNTQFWGLRMGCYAFWPLQCTIDVPARRQ